MSGNNLVKYWSPTELDVAQQSLMQWYFLYIEGEKNRLPLEPYYVKGNLVHHDLIKPFYDKYDARAETHSDAKAFAEYAKGMWWRKIIGAEEAVREGKRPPIVWSYEDQKWEIATQIRKLAIPLYDMLSNKERPIYSERRFRVELKQLGVDGRRMGLEWVPDEIRLEDSIIKIRDYKTGFLLQRPKIDYYGMQPAVNILGVLLAAYQNKEVAENLGLAKKEIPHLFRDNDSLAGRIEFDYVMLEDKDFRTREVKIKEIPAKITLERFHGLIKLIHDTWGAFVRGEIEPKLNSPICDKCPVRELCIERKENSNYKAGEQTKFDFAELPYRVRNVTVYGEPIKKSRRRVDTNTKRFKWNE